MNEIILLFLTSGIVLSVMWIIPTFAPKDKQQIIQDWLMFGFTGLLLVISLFTVDFENPYGYIPFTFYILVLALVISGVVWWIPSYVPVSNRTTATQLLFITATLSVMVVNLINKRSSATIFKSGLMGVEYMTPSLGGRRRK
jgi:hypothetical protein